MKSKYKKTLLRCLTVLLCGVVGCVSAPRTDDPVAPPPSVAPEDIVLTVVNGEELTLADALAAFQSSHQGHGSLVQGESAIRELAGRLIERRLFLAEAETLGIPEESDIVAAIDLRRLELAEGLFWKLEVNEKVEVSEQEVEDFYSRTDMALTVHYLETEDRDEAEALLLRVAAGEDFATLAEEHSNHPSRDFGGLMGYVRRGDLEGAIEDEIFALEEEGALTPVVATEHGFAFARFVEKTTNPNRPDREVALPQIRNVLLEQAKEKLKSEVEERLLQEAGVSVEESLLTRELVLATTTPEAVVARAGGEEFTLAELRDSLNLDVVRDSSDEAAVQKALLDLTHDWTRGWAVERAIDAAGLAEDPGIVKQVARYREDILLGWLYQHFIYADTAPTEEEIRAFYDENTEAKFTQPEELRLAYIVVGTEGEARHIFQRIENGEDFSVIATQESIDVSSAAHGGKISWVRRGQIIPVVEEAAFALEVGQYGGPISTEFGWFVLHLLERKAPVLVPFEFAKRKATAELVEVRQADAHAFWANRLRDRAQVEILKKGVQQATDWLDYEAEEAAAKKAAEEAAALAAKEEAAREMVGPMPNQDGGEDAPEDPGGSR